MAADGMVNIGQLARERHGATTRCLVGFGSYRGTVIAAPRWGVAGRGDGGAAGPAGLGRAAAARADAGAGACWSSAGDDQPGWVTDTADHRAIGVVYDPSFESWGNYVPTRLGERYDAFIWCDETTALHPLPARAVSGEMETYPAGV